MEFLKNLIEKINTPASECVGVHISSDSKLEVIVYDKELATVKNCEKIDLNYDNVQRQIVPEEFEAALFKLINKMGIPNNYPFYVCLPNILTSIKTLTSDLEDIELEVAFNSEAEKSYIFKKTEPKSSWNLISKNEQNLANTYIYSVIQRELLTRIQEIFAVNNLKLIAIDTSFAALVRGLAVSGILNENIENNTKWAIVTISPINYIIAKFEGPKLLNIQEMPIALKALDPEVLYSTIGSAVSEKLSADKPENLYIVSQTSYFIAEKLSGQINFSTNIHTIDNNKINGEYLFISKASSSLLSTSPESVGIACWKDAPIDLNFNFSDVNRETEIYGVLANIGIKKTLHLYLFMGIIGSTLLITIFSLLLLGFNTLLNMHIKKQYQQIGNLKKIKVDSPKVFKLENVKTRAYQKNLELITSYDAIGAAIPEKIWLDSFYIDGELNTVITGKAYNIEDIIIYFENLQKISKFKNLKIKSIKISSDGEVPGVIPQKTQEKDLALPPPPMPREEMTANTQNYYIFTFEDIKISNENNSLLQELPDPVKKLFGN